MMIPVPPAVGPEFGLNDEICGGAAVNEKPFALKAPPPSGLITVTSTVPTACTGVLIWIEVALLKTKLLPASEPNSTDAPD